MSSQTRSADNCFRIERAVETALITESLGQVTLSATAALPVIQFDPTTVAGGKI
jgi:hypothetical protein